MVINNSEQFIPMIEKMLVALGFESVVNVENKAYDLTAVKDGEKYCFKCTYEIDAVGEKKVAALIDAAKNEKFDKMVYVTNSSFISSAKKKGDAEGVLLWDRNTVDRMAIGIADQPLVEEVIEKKSALPVIIPVAVVVVLAALAAVYFFVLK